MKEAEYLMDVRFMEPCEPQVRILDAVAGLQAGRYLHVLHRMKPGVLGEMLRDRGLHCHAHASDVEVPVELFIWRDDDAAAWKFLVNDYPGIIRENAEEAPPFPSLPLERELVQTDNSSITSPTSLRKITPVPTSGLSGERIRRLQEQTAQALDLPVIFRDRLRDGSEGPEMVVIPPGKFHMGDATGKGEKSERPTHEVIIEKPLGFGLCPVTKGEFMSFAEATRYKTLAEREGGGSNWGGNKWEKNQDNNWRNGLPAQKEHPVVLVNWFDSNAFCEWLSVQTGHGYRLPTEAEWEYACRAGSEGDWCFGNDGDRLTEYAWYQENAENNHHSVKQKKANAFGVYDVHGNVDEWTISAWRYYGETQEYGITRVVRGGSWGNARQSVRAARRCFRNPTNRSSVMGFRLVRVL
uniref:Formylglycine-generating enzyme, required for sulfatase activity, contains SUMF1/FGE domain n=1 Tax=Candidatus Kentrum sp. FW TaxID=2126338 RepID=A0A450SFU4_9GAMM|nr:MAG: Formylglycine-generating enzyme, required for sulfatase activity, contains SUMF1/FGE domain [Candidatus Kentron sp. FW]